MGIETGSTSADCRTPEEQLTCTLDSGNMKTNKAGQSKDKISRWSFIFPIFLVVISVTAFATVIDDDDINDLKDVFRMTKGPELENEIEGTCGDDNGESACPITTDSNHELLRLRNENENLQKALAWIEERQKSFIDKFVTESSPSDKDLVMIKWLSEARDAYYKKFSTKK